MRNQNGGLEVFYSYSHKDENLRDELDKHLSLLQRQKLITAWHDRRITAGMEWKGAIDGHLAAADIILLLVSADFMASDYCFDIEMKLALERHQANEATVIPIILRPVDWSTAPFSHIQALPKDGKPVTIWSNQDEAYTNIAKGIKDAIYVRLENDLQQASLTHAEVVLDDMADEVPTVEDSSRNDSRNIQVSDQMADARTIGRQIVSLAERFNAQLHKYSDLNEPIHFGLGFSDVYLRGTNKPIPCMAVWTTTLDLKPVLTNLVNKAQRSFGIVFCFSQNVYEEVADQSLPHCCLLSPSEIGSLLRKRQDSLALLLKYVVGQIGIRRVSPYSTLLPATGNMFFGRASELDMLLQDRDTSFAIIGSSRIGKSSLLKQYRQLSLRTKQPNTKAQFLIDMYGCGSDLDSILRFIATHIDSSRRSNRIDEKDFISFVRYQANRLGGPLELLLDEADHLCLSTALEYLGQMAKQGLIRMILCGRGPLMHFAMDPKSSFSLRLQIIRPGPLEQAAARLALYAPMKDMGIKYDSEDSINHIYHMTGGLPFILQYYGQALVNLIEKTRSNIITLSMIEDFENLFETIHFMMRPLSEIDEPKEKMLAMSLLKSDKVTFTAAEISSIAAGDSEDERLEAHQIFDLCNALCIHGVLVYEQGKFKIANQALRDLALKAGYLDLLD